MHRMHEAHGEQDEIGLEVEFAAGNGLHLGIDARAMQRLDLAVLARESLGHDREVALGTFLMA